MQSISIDIVIVNYKSTDYLINCLWSIYSSIEKKKYTFKIYVQDNSETINVHLLTDLFPHVHYSANKKNIGFAAAINQTIRLSNSKYLLLLNPDTLVHNNFFEPIVNFMESHEKVSVIGPKIIDSDGSIQGSARAFPNAFTALYGRSSPLTRHFPNNPISRANIMTIDCDGISPLNVDWVSGACMFVRRKAIMDVGPLDENFFMYWEDADWCRRMSHNGWEVIYLPSARIYHFTGKSSASRPLRSIYHFHRSSYKLYAKYTSSLYAIFNPIVLFLLFARGLIIISLNIIGRGRIEKKQKIRPAAKGTEVLHIITRLIVGGAQENTLLTSRILKKKQWDVDIISGPQTGPEGSLESYANKNQLPLIYEPALVREIHPFKDLIAFLRIYRLIRKGRYPVVHTHSSKAGILGRWAAWLARVPVIIHTVHGWGFTKYQKPIIQKLYKFLERFTLRITDKLIVVTKLDINKGLKAGIGSTGDYELIRSGIELERFASPKRSWKAVRKELGIPLDAVVIGTVTRLSPQKAPLVFVRAAQQVVAQYPHTHFVIVGDGPLRGEVEALIQDLGLGEQIHLTGLRSDVPDLLSAFDIFTLSSLWEGLPRVLPQAMAAGLPIVASAIDGSMEIIQDHVNGRLFPPGDHAAMTQAIMDLIEEPEAARQMVMKGRQSVQEFDVNLMVDQIADLYLKTLQKKNIKADHNAHAVPKQPVFVK